MTRPRIDILQSWGGWLAAMSILHMSVFHLKFAGIVGPTSSGAVRTHRWEMAPGAQNLGLVKLLSVTLLWHLCLGGLHCFFSCPLKWQSYQRISTWLLCLIIIIHTWRQNLCLLFNNVTLGKRKIRRKKKKMWIYLKADMASLCAVLQDVLSTARKCQLFPISKMAVGALHWVF